MSQGELYSMSARMSGISDIRSLRMNKQIGENAWLLRVKPRTYPTVSIHCTPYTFLLIYRGQVYLIGQDVLKG